MCGICVVLEGLSCQSRVELFTAVCPTVNESSDRSSGVLERCLIQVARRGPSAPNGHLSPVLQTIHDTDGPSLAQRLQLHMHSSVLHLRGCNLTEQPLVLPTQDNLSVSFVWNGEVFGGRVFQECENFPHLSDTQIICDMLLNSYNSYAEGSTSSLIEFENEILQILEDIEGPFSTVIYFASPVNQLWIARDKIGRRSLCLIDDDPSSPFGSIIISSVGPAYLLCGSSAPQMTGEVGVSGVTILDLSQRDNNMSQHDNNQHDSKSLTTIGIRTVEWRQPVDFKSNEFWNSTTINATMGSSTSMNYHPIMTMRDEAVIALEAVLLRALKKRITNCPSISLMYSGGLDSGILLALLLKVLPANVDLDLLNVAFGNPFDAPDRFTALATYREIQRSILTAGNHVRLICVDLSKDDLKSAELEICSLVYPKNSHMDLNIGAPLYFASRGLGFVVRPKFHSGENSEWWSYYFNKCLPANIEKERQSDISLLPKFSIKNSLPCSECNLVRKPGCSFELCRLCCDRQGRQNAEHRCQVHRINGKSNLTERSDELRPKQCIYQSGAKQSDGNISDDSSLCSCCNAPVRQYQSVSPVILVGHGADELFGGYGRYITAGRHRGIDGARVEMIKDLGRLWERNLGRDDRCIAHWGRESRHPFLDEELIRFVGQLPFELLHSMSEDKPLLRQLGRRLNLGHCSKFKKRAIQFGSRSSRQTNCDHFSSHRKAKGTAKYIPTL